MSSNHQIISDATAPAFTLVDGVPVFNTHLQEQAEATLRTQPHRDPLDMPDECMYGFAGEIARKVGGPLSGCYLTVLALLAGAGVTTTDPELRTNLFVANIAAPNIGKSRIQSRLLTNVNQVIEGAPRINVVETDPASHQGIAQDFPSEGGPTPSAVYVLDELVNMLDACATPGSGRRLAGTLCSLFYKTSAGSSDKKGKHRIDGKISIVGNIPARDPKEFRKAFSVTTRGGLYDRFLFAVLPKTFQWDEFWSPTPIEWATGEITTHPDDTDDDWTASTRKLDLRNPVGIPRAVKEMAIKWRGEIPVDFVATEEQEVPSRGRLMELALRVAVISSAANGQSEVSPECMTAALCLADWQERVRKVYSPAEADNEHSECATAIEEKFRELQADKPRGYFFRWRDVSRRYHWLRKYARVLTQVKASLIADGHLVHMQVGQDARTGVPQYDKNLIRWTEEGE